MTSRRSAFARGATFAGFVAQQIGARSRVAREIAAVEAVPFTIDAPTTVLTAAETDWRGSGLKVRAGERFAVSARGAIWLSKPLSVVMEPRSTLWVRISGAPQIAKPADNDHVFTAWADGEVELFLKALSEWASPAGDLMSPERAPSVGEVRVRVALSDGPATDPGAPDGWRYLWRLGDGTVYAPGGAGEIKISTHGDVGILQTEVDHVLTPNTRLEWSWRVDQLPSRLPEDIQLTHDYLSVAVEFEDGKDLTFMWSAGLPHDHIFACPLNFWCERETHWVVRTPRDGLGRWLDESRALWGDTQKAYGARPAKAVRLWLIANSIFQRNHGVATIRGLKLFEAPRP
jgi:hypothetical protein